MSAADEQQYIPDIKLSCALDDVTPGLDVGHKKYLFPLYAWLG
jgi:hypothetical protein